MKAARGFLFLAMLLARAAAGAQAIDPFSLTATAGATVPLTGGSSFFTTGGSAVFAGEYRLPFLPFLAPRAEVSYDYMPVWTSGGTNFLGAGAGLSLIVPLGERFLASAYGSGGYYYGIAPGAGNGGNLYVAGGLGLAYAVQPFLSLGAEGRYRFLADGRNGSLLNGVSITLSARLTFLSPRKLKIQDLQLKPVFPVLYKYYATHPVGTLKLSNEGAVPLEDIKVSLSVERYMDGPTSCAAPKVLAPRSDGSVQLYALFNQSVLEITEGNVVSARVTVEYTVSGKPYTTEVTQPMRLYDRNAMTWDDDRKAAVYVTAKDPLILETAKPIARWSREQPTAFDGNFLVAMAIHESLRLHGVNYVVDPTSPYSDRTKTTLAIDYLQFPRFTLAYKAGDCDDLSILYAALLESVGVDTAFITIPNHIYLAIALKIPFEEAQRTFINKEDVIDFDGKAWIPLEVTMVQRRFLEAWSTGAREWRDNAARNAAKLLPMYLSWAEYEPVASVSGQGQVGFPPQQDLKDAYLKELQRFTSREIQSREDDLLKQAAQGKESWKPINALGVLYARYGQMDRAQARFEEALRKIQFGPALLNLGNIYLMKNQTDKALEYLLKAEKIIPEKPSVFLQIARCYYEMARYQDSLRYYSRLKTMDPILARSFAYLDTEGSGVGRASEADGAKEVMIWQDE
jgi:tetratricopeptide (TPR) repeat protein